MQKVVSPVFMPIVEVTTGIVSHYGAPGGVAAAICVPYRHGDSGAQLQATDAAFRFGDRSERVGAHDRRILQRSTRMDLLEHASGRPNHFRDDRNDGKLVAMHGGRVIAEHVDSHEKLENLRTLGVQYAQGYFVGEPKPFDLARKTDSGLRPLVSNAD